MRKKRITEKKNSKPKLRCIQAVMFFDKHMDPICIKHNKNIKIKHTKILPVSKKKKKLYSLFRHLIGFCFTLQIEEFEKAFNHKIT